MADAWIMSENLDSKISARPARNKKAYGLCHRCKCFRIRITEYDKEEGACDTYYNNTEHRWGLIPNRNDPIKECTDFVPKGQMEMDQMMSMAILIDVKKRSAGFMNDDPFEVSFKYPEKKEKRDRYGGE